MDLQEKSNYMRLQELKFTIAKIIVEWRFNGRELKARTGMIYKALADELESALKEFERSEHKINYKKIE